MRNLVFIIAIGLTILIGAFAFVFNAPRNVHALELARAYTTQSALTLEQLDQLSAEMDGRRAAIFLIGAARNAERSKSADVTLYQQQVLDLLQDRGLVQFLLPNEVNWVIAARRFACEVAYSRDRFADVLTQAERILAIAPDHPDGLVWKGIALGRMGKPDDAAALLARATASSSVSVDVLVRAAHFYFFWSPQRAWKDRALPLLMRAQQMEPQNSIVLRLLAEYWNDQNKCADGLAFAKQAVESSPNDSNAWGVLGHTYWCLNDKANARASYRRAIQIEPRLEPYFRERLAAP
jgi:tetratricopeptide (TPR) repeat protein